MRGERERERRKWRRKTEKETKTGLAFALSPRSGLHWDGGGGIYVFSGVAGKRDTGGKNWRENGKEGPFTASS